LALSCAYPHFKRLIVVVIDLNGMQTLEAYAARVRQSLIRGIAKKRAEMGLAKTVSPWLAVR
jgi:hypothetical protein